MSKALPAAAVPPPPPTAPLLLLLPRQRDVRASQQVRETRRPLVARRQRRPVTAPVARRGTILRQAAPLPQAPAAAVRPAIRPHRRLQGAAVPLEAEAALPAAAAAAVVPAEVAADNN